MAWFQKYKKQTPAVADKPLVRLAGTWLVAALTTSGATVNIAGLASRRFVPIAVRCVNGGTAVASATLVRVKEETSGTVLFSWPIAAWSGGDGSQAGIGTASAVYTGLGLAMTAGKGFVMDTTGANATACTSMTFEAVGYYI
jgi:hypothetical protein